MCLFRDNLARWEDHDSQQEKALARLPECEYCGEPIQDEYCFEINGEIICERCLIDNCRKSVDSIVR